MYIHLAIAIRMLAAQSQQSFPSRVAVPPAPYAAQTHCRWPASRRTVRCTASDVPPTRPLTPRTRPDQAVPKKIRQRPRHTDTDTHTCPHTHTHTHTQRFCTLACPYRNSCFSHTLSALAKHTLALSGRSDAMKYRPCMRQHSVRMPRHMPQTHSLATARK